jgi:hypothetical protein
MVASEKQRSFSLKIFFPANDGCKVHNDQEKNIPTVTHANKYLLCNDCISFFLNNNK